MQTVTQRFQEIIFEEVSLGLTAWKLEHPQATFNESFAEAQHLLKRAFRQYGMTLVAEMLGQASNALEARTH